MSRLTCLKPRVGKQPPSRLAAAGGAHGHEREHAAGGHKWRQIKHRIMSRDSGTCVICRAAGRFTLATDCDHIEPVWRGGTDAGRNLQPLCRPCHKTKTAAEATERAAGGVCPRL